MPTTDELNVRLTAVEDALSNTVTWLEYFNEMSEEDRRIHATALLRQIAPEITEEVQGQVVLKDWAQRIILET